jgi:hypothetical protein
VENARLFAVGGAVNTVNGQALGHKEFVFNEKEGNKRGVRDRFGHREFLARKCPVARKGAIVKAVAYVFGFNAYVPDAKHNSNTRNDKQRVCPRGGKQPREKYFYVLHRNMIENCCRRSFGRFFAFAVMFERSETSAKAQINAPSRMTAAMFSAFLYLRTIRESTLPLST